MFAVMVKTSWKGAGYKWRPFTIKVDRLTPKMVFAKSKYGSQLRYAKEHYKIKLFETGEDAMIELERILVGTGVSAANFADDEAHRLRREADAAVAALVSDWAEI